jgi:hypothetical protein
MKKWLTIVGLLALPLCTLTLGQDVSWLVDESPIVSMALVKALEKSPAFSAKADVCVSGKADPSPSAAKGTVEFQGGNLRWLVQLGDIRSAQLSQNARAVVRQINGDRFLLITRSDEKANYLILSGAHAYLEQPLASLRLSPSKAPVLTERIEGQVCSKETFRAVRSDGVTNEVLVWRAKDLKNLPVQIQLHDSGETVQVRFRDITLRSIPPGQFRVPAGLTKYSSLEDLVQSVLLDRVKKRMGL